MTVKEYALAQLHQMVRRDPWVREIFLAAGVSLDEMAERILAIYRFDDFSRLNGEQCAYYEGLLGLPADETAGLEARRAAIQAAWGGASKPSLETIQAACDAWEERGATAFYEDGALTLRFQGAVGIPDNLPVLKALIENIVAAHIPVIYAFRYLLIREVHGVMTLAELDATPLNHFAGG